MPYDEAYKTTDVNRMVVDVFGTALSSTMGWIDMLVLVVIVGLVVSILVGLMFKASHAFGFG